MVDTLCGQYIFVFSHANWNILILVMGLFFIANIPGAMNVIFTIQMNALCVIERKHQRKYFHLVLNANMDKLFLRVKPGIALEKGATKHFI